MYHLKLQEKNIQYSFNFQMLANFLGTKVQTTIINKLAKVKDLLQILVTRIKTHKEDVYQIIHIK